MELIAFGKQWGLGTCLRLEPGPRFLPRSDGFIPATPATMSCRAPHWAIPTPRQPRALPGSPTEAVASNAEQFL